MSSVISTPTAAGVRRRIRAWTRIAQPKSHPEVPGATEDELRQLACLGGLAFVFGYQEASQWPDHVVRWATHAPRPPAELIELVRRALEHQLDPFAEAYNASISIANRRRLGTVFTPDDVVAHMMDLVDEQLGEKQPAVVIDPGAGVGAFTLAAARRWPSARIVAVDINPVTLGLLGARLAFERRLDPSLKSVDVDLRLADYMKQLPKLFAKSEPGPVVALGNPPYTRTQALPAEYKRAAMELAGGTITSGHANLAMLFQAMTLAHMRPGDLSCMVLPASMVFTRAARDLRSALWEARRPVAVHRWPATRRAFIGREVQAAVLAVGPERADPGPVHIARVDTFAGRVEVTDSWLLPRDQSPPVRWYSRATESDATGVPLGSMVRIRRGVATGANSVFFLSDATAEQFDLKDLLPAVPSLRRFGDLVLDAEAHMELGSAGIRRWLLALDADHKLSSVVQAYLDANSEVAERYLCQQRSVWWAITDRPRPTILISPLSDTDFKVVENQVGAVPSNNLLGIWTPPEAATELANWLRSEGGQAELRRVSRRYQGGSHKIEPGDLRLARVPTAMESSLRSD